MIWLLACAPVVVDWPGELPEAAEGGELRGDSATPPEDSWPEPTACAAEPTGPTAQGPFGPLYAEGDVAEDQAFSDGHTLHDLCTQRVMVVTGSAWCAPCGLLSGRLQAIQDANPGVQVVKVLVEGPTGAPSTAQDRAAWAEEHGLETVWVVSDPEGWWGMVEADGAWPSISHFGTEAEVLSVDEGIEDPGRI